ncbi:MAG: recombinase family protein [Verrucomicrobiota bacterium]|jgi:DNA invertase Pin-like site-specific DNA recombinase
MNDKITVQHLERAAYVYIRQSTLQQVRHNVESGRRQYALENRARELGFKNVVVIDEDLGVSGTGSRERPGFGRLLAAVCNGEVGAVFALEASRLARNNRDWHHLIDLCVLTETIVIDAEGVYDPRLLNDRLLLGLKGTMSEFELGILRQRAQEAYRQKVLRGEVLTAVPIGYVRREPTGIEMTPDREVQEALRGVFAQFERLGTLRQVLLWYHQEKVALPVWRRRDGAESIIWRLPNYEQLLRVLRNPTYAGAFAYGRTCSSARMVEGRSRRSAGHRVAMEQWLVLLKDHHAAYISWERYMENQRILSSNRTKSHAAACGAARKGSALLAGLLRCARCGRKLHVAYRGRDGRAPRYYCFTGNIEFGKPSCLRFGGIRAEEAVVEAVLAACQPMGVEASLQAMEGNQTEQEQKRRALQLALERARYEADRARRQFDAVDPANRLVAAELEARWNAALSQVSEAQGRLDAEQHCQEPLDENQRRRLLALGADLQALWHNPASPMELKKRILRAVVHEIIVDVNHASGHLEMRVHWAGGVHTVLNVRQYQPGRNAHATDRNVVELVRELATAQPDSFIAATLNRLGYRTGPGNSWNETRVKNLRQYHKIPVFEAGSGRPWLTMSEVANELNVGAGVIRTMIQHGILPARQIAKYAPWMIAREDLRKTEVQNYASHAHTGKFAPRGPDTQTLMPYL